MKFNSDSLLLYAVTDRGWVGRQTLCEQIEDALKGGATCIQLREKELDEAAFLAEAQEVKALCRRYGVPFIAFCLGLALGGWISSLAAWPQDLCCAAGALGLCAASLPLVRRAGRALKKCGQLKVCVRRQGE